MKSTQIFSRIEGVVLAGGLNKRYNGRVKANLLVKDKAIIAQTLDILDNIFSRVSIIANDKEAFKAYSSYPLYNDIFRNVGPLGGIHAALANTKADAVFVVASDMPELSPALIREMCEVFLEKDYDALVPWKGEQREPLHAIYSRSIYSGLNDYLTNNNRYAIVDFLSGLNAGKFLTGESTPFTNINSPEDMQNFSDNISDKL